MTDAAGRVERSIREFERERANDAQFVRLREFMLEMQRRGLVIKKEYDLPPLDTIGRTAFRTDS